MIIESHVYTGQTALFAAAVDAIRHVHDAEKTELAVIAGLTTDDIDKASPDFIDYAAQMMSDGNARVVYVDGVPVGVFGCSEMENVTDISCVWALIDDRLSPRKVMQASYFGLQALQSMVRTTWGMNYVHWKNERSRRWLKHLGAQFSPEPVTINNDVFYPFFMRF